MAGPAIPPGRSTDAYILWVVQLRGYVHVARHAHPGVSINKVSTKFSRGLNLARARFGREHKSNLGKQIHIFANRFVRRYVNSYRF